MRVLLGLIPRPQEWRSDCENGDDVLLPRFAFLRGCGCVFSEKALREVPSDTCHKVRSRWERMIKARPGGGLEKDSVSNFMAKFAFYLPLISLPLCV